MIFDTVIIGGGSSGLACGIRLQEAGKKCVIISSGQSALHFSSGSFDLLNTLPDGTKVTSPIDALKELKRNPWELWFTITYMTLEKCDEIARILNLDIETDSRRRTAIVRHAMQSTLDNLGYTYLPKNMATALYEENFQDLMEFDEYIYHLTQTEEIFEIPQGYQAKPLYYGENKIIRGVDNLLQRHFRPTSEPKSTIGTLKLTDEQYNAVCQSLLNGLFILTGGPGVGKTTTLKAIIQAHIDEYRLTAENIVLMAPTGKAAQRMMEQTGLPATTIHKKLILSPGNSFVKDDVIIGVNRDRVQSIAEMRKVLEAKPNIIALHVVRGNDTLYLLLR